MADKPTWKERLKARGKKFWKQGLGELGAAARQGTNDARNIIMGPWGEGEKVPGTAGYPTQQEVTDSFGGTYEQRMEEARKGREQAAGKDKGKDKSKGKDKGREIGD